MYVIIQRDGVGVGVWGGLRIVALSVCSWALPSKEGAARGGINTPLRETGERAMHRAASLGHVQKLKWLILHGADVAAATSPALDMCPVSP